MSDNILIMSWYVRMWSYTNNMFRVLFIINYVIYQSYMSPLMLSVINKMFCKLYHCIGYVLWMYIWSMKQITTMVYRIRPN